jgi:hypothetical protein
MAVLTGAADRFSLRENVALVPLQGEPLAFARYHLSCPAGEAGTPGLDPGVAGEGRAVADRQCRPPPSSLPLPPQARGERGKNTASCPMRFPSPQREGKPHRVTGAILLALLAACSTVRGRPEFPANLDAEVSQLAPLHDAAAIEACLKLPVADSRACRDSIVQARLIAIDVRYTQFRHAFYGEARWGGFAATVATLGLTSAAALASLGTSHILSAAATGVTGTQAAYDKQVLIDRTATAIETSMDAARGTVAIRIRQGLQRPPPDYPLAVALSDLQDYYNAGTLLGALADITRIAGVQAQNVDEQLKTISGFVATPAAEFLRNYINPPGATDAIREQRLADVDRAEKQAGIPYQLPSVLATAGDKSQVEKVARALGWTGQ